MPFGIFVARPVYWIVIPFAARVKNQLGWFAGVRGEFVLKFTGGVGVTIDTSHVLIGWLKGVVIKHSFHIRNS